jgi:hypothetical protein
MEQQNNNVTYLRDLKLERDTFITIMSMRKTGKSVLCADLIYYFLTDPNNKVDFVYMFSNTATMDTGTNDQYDFIDKKAIIPASPNIMNKVINGLFYSQKKTNFKYKILLVFDDIVVTKKYEIIEYVASAGRHHGITCILSAQVSNLVISPTIRSNMSYLFWRRLGSMSIRDNILPFLGYAFEHSKDLIDFTKQNIDNYQFIFYNNNTDFNEDSIKIVRSEEVPKDFKYRIKFDDDTNKPRTNAINKFQGKTKYAFLQDSFMKPRF